MPAHSVDKKILKPVKELSKLYGIDCNLALAIIKQESSFNVMAKGKDNEVGLMQLHPRYFKGATYDIKNNVSIGLAYLSKVKTRCEKRYGSLYYICYNFGPSIRLPLDKVKKINYVIKIENYKKQLLCKE